MERVVLNALTKTRGFAARHLGLRPNNWHRLEDKPIHLCSGRVQIRAAFAVELMAGKMPPLTVPKPTR